jgi:hypothetical protein
MISLKMASEHCDPQHFVRHRKRIVFDGRRDLVVMTLAKATTNCADCVETQRRTAIFFTHNFYAQFEPVPVWCNADRNSKPDC